LGNILEISVTAWEPQSITVDFNENMHTVHVHCKQPGYIHWSNNHVTQAAMQQTEYHAQNSKCPFLVMWRLKWSNAAV